MLITFLTEPWQELLKLYIQGESETEGKCIIASEGWRPLHVDVKNFDPKNKNTLKRVLLKK